MKKILCGVLLISSLIAGANVFALDKGANICGTILAVLHQNGYSENAAYTPEGIVQLLQKSNIDAPDMSSFTSGQHYTLTYNCSIKNKLAKPKLIAIPQDQTIPSSTVTIKWKATKPIRG